MMTTASPPTENAPCLEHCLLACQVLEASAPKAGNVHPGASFDDCTWLDFVTSAIVSSPVLARAGEMGVGPCVLEAVRQTRAAVDANTNLGMILLLAPLAAAAVEEASLAVAPVLASLDDHDARALYQAIALAGPGGLGRVDRGDVEAGDVLPVSQAMALAAERDIIARQYATGFADVFSLAQWLTGEASQRPLDEAIVRAHLHQMSTTPDTLIARKLGSAMAQQAADRAAAVLAAGREKEAEAMAAFDRWLREDGNRRNPGASADMVAAALFVALRLEKLALPARWHEEFPS